MRATVVGHRLVGVLPLLPRIGFVGYDDSRMCRTTNAIMEPLERGGLLLRYDMPG